MRAKIVNEYQNFERGQDPKKALNIGVVDKIAENTSGAYSVDRYGEVWEEIIAFLLGDGVSQAAIEWILKSKHMRWAGDRMEPNMNVDSFIDYYETDQNGILATLSGETWMNEDMGGVSGPMSTLGNTPGMGNAQPAASASTGSLDGAPEGSGDNWDSSTGIKPAVQEGMNENNINPHDKLGVAMAKKIGAALPFKKGKGDKDVEQTEIDEDVDLSTKLTTFDEWAKQFLAQ